MTLYFNGRLVATLSEAFEDQGTWFAEYTLVADLDDRINQFVEFNHHQLSTGEFDEDILRGFADLTENNGWHVEGEAGRQLIDGAPLFREIDVSWICREMT